MKRILALTGGGVRGCMHLGALHAISTVTQEEYLYKVFQKGIYGISIGAILGSMIGFGIPTHRLMQNVDVFTRASHVFEFKDILGTFSRKGISTGDSIHGMLRELFHKEGLDLDSLRIGDSRVPLHILATDVQSCKVITFGNSVKLWDALRASFSLPVLFTPHVIGSRIYVDAACLVHTPYCNIPREDRNDVLMIALTKKPSENIHEDDLGGFLFRIMSMASIREIKQAVSKYPEHVCVIEESTIGVAHDCTKEDIEHMLHIGKEAMQVYLAKYPFIYPEK
jgi:NTE family protein